MVLFFYVLLVVGFLYFGLFLFGVRMEFYFGFRGMCVSGS